MKDAQLRPLSRSEALAADDQKGRNPSTQPGFAAVLQQRHARRDVLKGALGLAALTAAVAVPSFLLSRRRPALAAVEAFDFEAVAAGVDEHHHVAPGYDVQVLLRWGDPVLPGAPAFDPYHQSASAQAQQFGYNCDFVGFFPLDGRADRGLLCVNHEYTVEQLMFPSLRRQDAAGVDFAEITEELVEIEMAAHGVSIVEIERRQPEWAVVADSRHARRITTSTTPMLLSGPAAGHPRLQTSADDSGRHVMGTVNNCAGGITPWGTLLVAEENFHYYFGGALPSGHAEHRNHQRYGVPAGRYAWSRFHRRFDVGQEPHEANRFGWMVEVDVNDPTSTPIKRTALGRMKHEGANCIVNSDGRVVAYMGDDEEFEYVYRFVSEDRIRPGQETPADLLDRGTLSVARFAADGTLVWLPLRQGEGALTVENGFPTQADVLIETRRAADLLRATPMDRPEELEIHPRTQRVYVMLTNNSRRLDSQCDAVNERAANRWGQILELIPPDGDHAAATARWEMLVRCGDPSGEVGARWGAGESADASDWFACPDNAAVDGRGRLWIATDQGDAWGAASGCADGLYALDTEGPARGRSRRFFRAPVGAEICGPAFTPDDETLFLAVQHPGDDGVASYAAFGRESTFDDPATRWPDFDPHMPPRPSVVAITRRGGGKIG